jgi:hypothetical protein
VARQNSFSFIQGCFIESLLSSEAVLRLSRRQEIKIIRAATRRRGAKKNENDGSHLTRH